MTDVCDYWSLPELLERLPAPGNPLTNGQSYFRDVRLDEYVIAGPGYLPIVDRMWDAFHAASFPDTGQYDYVEWRDNYLSRIEADQFNSDHVATMTMSDCFYLLRTLQRAERFCDGAWIAAHEQGLFHAVARRLINLAGGKPR